MNTQRFSTLAIRVNEICSYYLPESADPLGDYNARQVSDASACILLIHAEFENYLEDLSISLAAYALRCIQIDEFNSLAAAFLYKAGTSKGVSSQNHTNFVGVATAYKEQHERNVENNHGLKSNHIKNLFAPFDMALVFDDTDALADFDSFGSLRGRIAHHRLTRGIRHDINPYEIREMIDRLLDYLRSFDEKVAQYIEQ